MLSKQAIISKAEYKCMEWELHLKLRNQQLKTTLFLYRLLNQNHMGNANPNPPPKKKTTISTHEEKQPKQST